MEQCIKRIRSDRMPQKTLFTFVKLLHVAGHHDQMSPGTILPDLSNCTCIDLCYNFHIIQPKIQVGLRVETGNRPTL